MRSGLAELYPRLWRYALSLSGRQDWAEELAQRTCIRAIENADRFTPGTHLDRWLFRIQHNIWMNELRSQKVRTGQGLVAVEDTPLPGTRPNSEQNIFVSEVLSAVNNLPEAQRACVLLAYVEGYSYRECAEILDVPVGTIMSRLSAARQRLAPLKDTW